MFAVEGEFIEEDVLFEAVAAAFSFEQAPVKFCQNGIKDGSCCFFECLCHEDYTKPSFCSSAPQSM